MKDTFSRTRLPFFLTPLGLILANCGGGGSSSGGSGASVSQDPPGFGGGGGGGGFSPFNVGGNVVKGPLSNALVFLDYDGDGIQDSDEPSVRTDSSGGYTITAAQADYTLVAVADETTIDTSSGTVLSDVVLKAPAGATVVTPTTTIMKESNLSADEVAAVLDLPDGIDPTSFNPYGSGVDAAKALAVEKISQQV